MVKLLFLSLFFEKHVDEQGGSNDLHHIKIDQRKGVALDDFISYWPSIESAKRIGIKTTTISNCRKILISQQIWERIFVEW